MHACMHECVCKPFYQFILDPDSGTKEALPYITSSGGKAVSWFVSVPTEPNTFLPVTVMSKAGREGVVAQLLYDDDRYERFMQRRGMGVDASLPPFMARSPPLPSAWRPGVRPPDLDETITMLFRFAAMRPDPSMVQSTCKNLILTLEKYFQKMT